MAGRLGTVAGIVLALVAGNALLTGYLVHVLGREGASRLQQLRQDHEDVLVAEVRGRVDATCSVIRQIQKISDTPEEARQAAIRAVTDIRFRDDNYIWVHVIDPETRRTTAMPVHPAGGLRTPDNPWVEDWGGATHLYHEGEIVARDDPRVKHIKAVDIGTAFAEIALTKGEGLISYYWPRIIDGKPTTEAYRKVAYIKYLPEWNWVVGAGAYADAVDRAVKERAEQLQREQARLVWNVAGGMALVSVIIAIIVTALSWRFTRRQILALTAEVDERTRTEDALRRISVLQEAILDNAGYAIIAGSPGGMVTTFNPAAARMLGYRPEEVIGRLNVVAFHDLAEMEARAGELAAELGIPRPNGFEVFTARPLRGLSEEREWTFVRKDGTRFPILLSVTVLKDADSQIYGFLGIAVDISGRKRSEEEVRQALKMESVGRLAGGVAHDFNNMLGVILGYTEQALDQTAPDSLLRADLEEVRKAALRSADLTRRLLAFARRQAIEPRSLELNETVDGMLRMLRRLIGEGIDLLWCPESGLWPVWIDPSQVDQLLANLCVNARDAIGDVGKVTIETHNATLDESCCDGRTEMIPGDYVVLALSDDGCGMDKETMDHLFEPFYTTKGVGQGTGLGLATVYGIVKQNRGFIRVYSEPGHGTTFRIYLPRHHGGNASAPAVLPEPNAEHGQETVLLVEDETAILSLTTRLLNRMGYHVLAASTPAEALRIVSEHPGEIHLLMTDVIMPGMNGRDLATQLQSSHRGLRCLFMSGYTADVIAHHGVLDGDVPFIEKPFTGSELARKVRQALDLA